MQNRFSKEPDVKKTQFTHSIVPQGINAIMIQTIRDSLKRKYFRNVSWNEVLTEIFRRLSEVEKLKKRVEKLEQLKDVALDKRANFAENIALKLAEQPKAPIMAMAQSNPTFQNLQSQGALTPPPAPNILPQPSKKAPLFIKTMHKAFQNGAILPSEVKAFELKEEKEIENKKEEIIEVCKE